MAGLIPALLASLWFVVAAAAPHPSQEAPDSSVLARSRDRLLQLMDRPAPDDPAWRRAVFPNLVRLEHAPMSEVLEAWELLAATGDDFDRGNLILHRRRHALPLPPRNAEAEGPAQTLERALAAWGERDFAVTAALLREGVARWPEDERFADDLRWLRGEPAAAVPRVPKPRDVALHQLVARGLLRPAEDDRVR